MKPKQLAVTILLFFIARTGFAQPKRISERLMAHDTSLVFFKRVETGKYIVAAAIAKPTLMYYLIDRYGTAWDSTRMRPDDYKLLVRYQYDAFAYYPAAINLRRKYRREVIGELRIYKYVRPASPYYDAVTYDHPELIRPDSITLLKGIIRLQRENMRDSIYLWGYNIDDPKRIKPGQKTATATPVSNKTGNPRIFINPDRFSSLYSAEVDTQGLRVSYYSRKHQQIASLGIDTRTAANSSPPALFEYYLLYLEKARQLSDERLNRLKNSPIQYASLNDSKINSVAAALEEQHAVDLSICDVTNPDLESLSGNLKETYSHVAVNARWLKFLGITYDTTPASWDSVGTKRYELDNHLGNVLVTITDKRIQDNSGDTPVFYADPASAQDYYPFGMIMPERQWVSESDSTYRYGFNGKENDNTVKGLGNQVDYGMRIYDPRGGRFLSVDPLFKQYPELSSYQFASNTPIQAIDIGGQEKLIVNRVDNISRTAKLTIVKTVDVIRTDLPRDLANLNSKNFSKIFSKGNEVLYMQKLPENGQPVNYIDKRDYKNGKGYAVDVSYDVNLKYIPDASSVTFDAETSTVRMYPGKGNSLFKNDDIFATSSTDGSNSVFVNKRFKLLGHSGAMPATFEQLVAHEVGFHNMMESLHAEDPATKGPLYPQDSPTLESNVGDYIYPTTSNTQTIIQKATMRGNVENGEIHAAKPNADIPDAKISNPPIK